MIYQQKFLGSPVHKGLTNEQEVMRFELTPNGDIHDMLHENRNVHGHPWTLQLLPYFIIPMNTSYHKFIVMQWCVTSLRVWFLSNYGIKAIVNHPHFLGGINPQDMGGLLLLYQHELWYPIVYRMAIAQLLNTLPSPILWDYARQAAQRTWQMPIVWLSGYPVCTRYMGVQVEVSGLDTGLSFRVVTWNQSTLGWPKLHPVSLWLKMVAKV